MRISFPPLENGKESLGGFRIEKKWKWAALYFGIWTMVSLYLCSADLWFMRKSMSVEFTPARLGMFMVRGYGWALISLITLFFIRRMPLHRDATKATWFAHAVLGFMITLTGLAMEAFEVPWFYPSPASFGSLWWLMVTRNFHFSYLVYYWGTVAIHEGIQLLWLTKAREQLAHQLQAKLTRAQLNALKMQLSPHFLFNTLNVVAAQIHSCPCDANQLLLKLSELLRTSLSRTNEPEIPLKQEVAFIKAYLEIERLRFRDRLQFDLHIDDSASVACVPTFILQPLVESVVRVAIAPFANGARICIRGRLEGSNLVLEVEHDGPGVEGRLPDFASDLEVINQRLEPFCGKDHEIHVLTPPSRGALVRLIFPFLHPTPLWGPVEAEP